MPRTLSRAVLLITLLLTAGHAVADQNVPHDPTGYQPPHYVEPAPKGNISLEKQLPNGHAARQTSDHVRYLGLLCPPGSGPNPAGPGGCLPCRPLHKGDPHGACAM